MSNIIQFPKKKKQKEFIVSSDKISFKQEDNILYFKQTKDLEMMYPQDIDPAGWYAWYAELVDAMEIEGDDDDK